MLENSGPALKRAFDVVGALALGAALSPVMALTALAVRLDLGGPVLFRQERVGRGFKAFTIYKFRTMHPLSETFNQLADEGSRLTPLSRKLRKFSLDELPQLWNVLKGDMSLVGPRPSSFRNVPTHDTSHPRYRMRPGLTGEAQVAGRNEVAISRRLEIDRDYVQNWSLRRDFQILAKTVPVWLTGKGYRDPGMPRSIPQ